MKVSDELFILFLQERLSLLDSLVNENDIGQEDLILEIRNLQDELDSCLTGKLTNDKLNKQKKEFENRDNGIPNYMTPSGNPIVSPPRRDFREEMLRLEVENNELRKSLETGKE